MSKPGCCPQCDTELPAGLSPGLCPKCLLASASASPPGTGAGAAAQDRGVHDGSSLAGRQSEVLAGYELLEQIGRGGMGVVYRARQHALERVVAIKLLPPGGLMDKAQVHRFRTEAAAAGSLQHPNIVSIHEVGLSDDRHYLVMDYVEGFTLAELASTGPLAAGRASRYVRTIAQAVHFAHEHGILHRDLKPSNILVDHADQPRITDFGLAKRLESGSDLTLSGQVLGSPQYMPPEQAAGRQQQVGRRSDVYALGAILYHLLTGRAPFVGETVADVLSQVADQEPLRPRELNPAIPPDLETVCLKCLEKEPARRYPTALALAEELDRYLRGEPLLARPIGRVAKTWRWARRNPRLASALSLALLSVLTGLAGVTWGWHRAASQQTRAEVGELQARRHAYAADMMEVQRALEDNDLARARQLLARHRPAQGSSASHPDPLNIDLRGWEWRYFWRQCQGDEQVTLCQYSNPVSALALSPDGKRLAVRRNDGIGVWDVTNRRLVSELAVQGPGLYKALAISPFGKVLASGGGDPARAPCVSLRDLDSGSITVSLPLSSPAVSLAFSPDARALAVLAFDGNVRLCELESQQVITQFMTAKLNMDRERFSGAARVTQISPRDALRQGGAVPPAPGRARFVTANMHMLHYGCVIFSPDGRWLVAGAAEPRLHLLDRTTGTRKTIAVPEPADGITALAFSPDSRYLVAGCGTAESEIHVWDFTTGTDLRLAGHKGWIADLAFSPDGRTLASASADQTIRLWDLATKTEVRRLRGNTDEVWALVWLPHGRGILSASRDGSVRLWDMAAESVPARKVLPVSIWPHGPSFLPDSKSFMAPTAPEGAVMRFDAVTGKILERLSFPGTNHSSLALSPDGRWLALGSRMGNVQVWDHTSKLLVTNLACPKSTVAVVFFSDAGGLLAAGLLPWAGGAGGSLWTVPGWREVYLRGPRPWNISAARISPDERTLATGHWGGAATWWDIVTGEKRTAFDSDYTIDSQVAFSPDGKLFATASLDGLITLWDSATARVRRKSRAYRNTLHAITFSPDGERLVASGTTPNQVVKLWDVVTGREVAILPCDPGWYSVGFSPDGNTLFAAGMEGTTVLWHAPSFAHIEQTERKPASQ